MLLDDEAPDLVAAIEYVISASNASHVPAPVLTDGERQPEDVPEVGLYDGALDAQAPRKLSDVWQGHGDYDDAFVPLEDPDYVAASRHDADLFAKRMREDSDKTLDYPFRRTPPEV